MKAKILFLSEDRFCTCSFATNEVRFCDRLSRAGTWGRRHFATVDGNIMVSLIGIVLQTDAPKSQL